MPFIADSKTLTTADPERGLALVKKGGGSDGVLYFAIEEEGGASLGFSAHIEFESNPELTTDKEAVPNRGIWRVHWWGFPLGRHDVASTMAIIREALEAYKGAQGTPVRQPFRVEFTHGASDEVVG
jgi:hypothetical protein